MAEKKKIEAATEFFTGNPFYKRKLETAPSETCKDYIKLSFYWSAFIGANDFQEEKKELEDKMDLADWEHLLKYCGNNPFHTVICRHIWELKQKAREDGGEVQ